MPESKKVSETLNKGGRPRKLLANDATLKQLTGLGNIQATVREAAAFFQVSPVTLEAFLKEPGVREAFEAGKGNGLISLRRRQFQLAEKSAAMAIWLGKQYLEQRDKHMIGQDPDLGPLGVVELPRKDAPRDV